MLVSEFNFDLPKNLIASHPASPRDSAKLLCISKKNLDRKISDLPLILKKGDLLVFNDTKVIPARILGKRGEAKIEVMLHKNIKDSIWKVFAKPGKKLKVGDIFTVGEDFSAKVLEKKDTEVTLDFSISGEDFYNKIYQYGLPPLPPYIERYKDAAKEDVENYQTIYAKNTGAVAAPTAGLHFTEKLFNELNSKGIDKTFVTLHVGAGTFLPVKAEDTKDHVMHSEYCVVNVDTAEKINAARRRGGRIIAVGTTSLRVLETVADQNGNMKDFSGETDIFITPGYKFKIVDVLLTNFHLPKSTLFMLVSAFAGFEKMKNAYKYAIENSYRFYSYGDACLLEKNYE